MIRHSGFGGVGSRVGELASVLAGWISLRETSLQLLPPRLAHAGRRFGNQNVARRAPNPVAVSVSTPGACAGPCRRVRDDPRRAPRFIFGTAAALGARWTPTRSLRRPLAHVPDPVADPATTLGARRTPPRFPFRGPARVSGRCKSRKWVVFTYFALVCHCLWCLREAENALMQKQTFARGTTELLQTMRLNRSLSSVPSELGSFVTRTQY